MSRRITENMTEDDIRKSKITESKVIKEFAGRLKAKCDITNFDNPYGVSFKVIDNLVKEMTEVNENERT